MPETFANFDAVTALAANCDDSETTLTVADAAGLDTGGNLRVRIDDELMLVTEVDGDDVTVTRGVEGTLAASHASGATVYPVLTAGGLRQALDDIELTPGPPGDPGADGANGESAYGYIGYASDDAGTDFSLTPGSALDYVAFLMSDTEIVTPGAGDFSGLWKNYKGATGATGATGPAGADGEDGEALAFSSFSSSPGTIGLEPAFYAATVATSYVKTLDSAASVLDGTIIEIRIVSLTGSSQLTIAPHGSDVIRFCGADLTQMVLTRLGAELRLRKRGLGWDVVRVQGRQTQEVLLHTPTGYGSSSTYVRLYATSQVTGDDLTAASSSSLGSRITCVTGGLYFISMADGTSGQIRISRNSANLNSTPVPSEIIHAINSSLSGHQSIGGVAYLRPGDIIRGQTGSAQPTGNLDVDFLFAIRIF